MMNGIFRALLLVCLVTIASGVQAKEYYCSTERICSEEVPCYAPEYVADFLVLDTGARWIITNLPDDGTTETFRRVEGTDKASPAMFLLKVGLDDDPEERVTLLTILPDLRFFYTLHSNSEFDAAGTSYGSCEVTLE